MSPTQRSLKLLRAEGFLVATVEKWIPGMNIRQDLFGFGDLLAVSPSKRRFLIVQVTTWPNVGARLKKAKGLAALTTWLEAGGEFEVHGWKLHESRWIVSRTGVNAEASDLAEVKLSPAPKRRTKRVTEGLFAGLV